MNKDNKFENTVGIESTFPKDMPNEHGEIPVWNSENWFYEDVIVAVSYTHLTLPTKRIV